MAGRPLSKAPQSFCKCTCSSNSSIIELDHLTFTPAQTSSSSSSKNNDASKKTHPQCSDCTRKFCLEHAQPECQGVRDEEEIITECFQRDSKKDKAIVYVFIITTASLLVYAAVKPWADKWMANLGRRRLYMPLSERRIGA
ncbi:hypothetical protein KEM55_008550 [Ascosphaera atra]|nr:hypothetical protein KEM55_008550 [Ascosphaera atra]